MNLPEIVWLPKAIGEKPAPKFRDKCRRLTLAGFEPIRSTLVGGFPFLPNRSHSLIDFRQPGPFHRQPMVRFGVF